MGGTIKEPKHRQHDNIKMELTFWRRNYFFNFSTPIYIKCE